jgi:hypothetical protein
MQQGEPRLVSWKQTENLIEYSSGVRQKAARSSRLTAAFFLLNWWTWNVAIRAIHAAVAILWPHYRPATLAFRKELAGIRRHFFSRLMPALRASQRRIQYRLIHHCRH